MEKYESSKESNFNKEILVKDILKKDSSKLKRASTKIQEV